jgi:type II secretory pathway component PulJ
VKVHQPLPLRRSRAGFTLAEIMVTVLIMAGILVSITQILHTARISRDNIHNIQETQLAGPAIMDMIERDLRSLLIYNRTKQDHFRVVDRVIMGVNSDSIDFVAASVNRVLRVDGSRFLSTPINEVGYRLRPNPEYNEFMEIYRREDAAIDEDPFEGGEFVFLHDRVKDFNINIFAEDGPDAEPYEEWGAREGAEEIGVPARLEITMTLELKRRIEREALRVASADLTEVTYRRIIRLPDELRVSEEAIAVPLIPSPDAGGEEVATGGGGGGGGGEDLPGGEGGGGTGGLDGGGNDSRSGGSSSGREGSPGGATRVPGT